MTAVALGATALSVYAMATVEGVRSSIDALRSSDASQFEKGLALVALMSMPADVATGGEARYGREALERALLGLEKHDVPVVRDATEHLAKNGASAA